MEREDHRLVAREQFVEVLVFHTVRMLRLRLQDHQIHDVDHADSDIGIMRAQQRDGGERLQSRDVAGAGHDHVGIAVVVARPVPDAGANGAVARGRLDIEPLPFRLLPRHDQVDVVAAAQAVVGDGKKAVGVGRKVDAHDIGLLVRDVIDEAGILMREAIMVLPPDMRSEQVVQGRDRPAPGNVPC